jgi:hypothetical protein
VHVREDDELNELIVETLMKALVDEERLPRERVERGVRRFLEAMKRERGPVSRRWLNEWGNGGKRSR